MTDTSAATDWRFFRWMRGMDVPRRAGWIGGVCAGIADRIRIDPIIVRGVAVVLAVLGAPALLLYAAAWMLLPDTDDRIHLERLLRGRFDPAVVGAGVMLLLQLTPLTAGFWFLGYSYWSEPYGGGAWFLRVLWTGFMLTAVVLFILWMARRARNAEQRAAFAASGAQGAPAWSGPDAGPVSGAWVASATGTVAEGAPSPDAAPAPSAHAAFPASSAQSPAPHPAAPAGPTPQPGEPVAPAPPAADAPAEQLAAWRQQHESWKLHHAAWSAQQRQGADAAIRRELAARRAAEREAMRSEWREQQRRRRAANPRVGFIATVLTIGVAVLGAGIVVLALRSAGHGEVSLVAAFATAAALFGAAMIVAGAARRRSGFLAFLASVSLVVASLGALVPADREFIPWASAQRDLAESGSYSQLAGNLSFVFQRPTDEDGMMLDLVDGVQHAEGAIHVPGSTGTQRIDLWQAAGYVNVQVPINAVVAFDLDLGDNANVWYNEWSQDGGYEYPSLPEVDGRFEQTIGDGEGVDVIITGWLGASSMEISRQVADEPATDSETEEVQP